MEGSFANEVGPSYTTFDPCISTLYPPPIIKLKPVENMSTSMSNTFNIREMVSSNLSFQLGTLATIKEQLKEGKTANAELFLDQHLMKLSSGLTNREQLSEIKIICNMREHKNQSQKLQFLKAYFDDCFECTALTLRKLDLVFQEFKK